MRYAVAMLCNVTCAQLRPLVGVWKRPSVRSNGSACQKTRS